MGRMKNTVFLLLTAIIWGAAFVAQSVGMDYVGAFSFNCVRCILGGFSLLPVIFIRKRHGNQKKGERRNLLTGGAACGVILAAASSLQQIGIGYTTTGKAGFLTTIYIVIVPLLGIFFHRKPKPIIWGSVVLAIAGMYFLCMGKGGGFSLGVGDAALILCAVLFSFHILTVDHFSPLVDGVELSCVQFFVSGIVCGVFMLLFETPNLSQLLLAWVPLFYAGLLSCGVGYTLQIVGQRDYDPTVASLLLSLESVFSALAGWLLLGQTMQPRELFGCALVFAAVICAQLAGQQK